jgi:hypothetical protein
MRRRQRKLRACNARLVPLSQVACAVGVLGSARGLCDGKSGACLGAQSGTAVLLAALDVMLPAWSVAGNPPVDSTPYGAVCGQAVALLEASCDRIPLYMAAEPGLKPRLVVSLLSTQRLLRWFRSLREMKTGKAAMSVTALLRRGVTEGQGDAGSGGTDIPASKAAEVSARWLGSMACCFVAGWRKHCPRGLLCLLAQLAELCRTSSAELTAVKR